MEEIIDEINVNAEASKLMLILNLNPSQLILTYVFYCYNFTPAILSLSKALNDFNFLLIKMKDENLLKKKAGKRSACFFKRLMYFL